MKLLKLAILLFCIAMLVSAIIGIKSELQRDYEAVKGLSVWMN